MNTAELGQRIKEARIAKKMTQSQVVGTFITRNMLSQIENGIAMPSIHTLEYLAEVLDLPDLLDLTASGSESVNEEHSHVMDVASAITAAKQAARSGDWTALVSMEDSYPEELEDEFQALLAKAFLALAKAETSNPPVSAAYLSKAIHYADCGLYANASVKAEAVILLQQAASHITDSNEF